MKRLGKLPGLCLLTLCAVLALTAAAAADGYSVDGVSMNRAEGTATVALTAAGDCKLFTALYGGNGRFLGSAASSLSGADGVQYVTVTFPSGIGKDDTVYAFLLDGNSAPLCEKAAGLDEPQTESGPTVLSINGAAYSLGMTEAALTARAGQPDETLSSTAGFRWYVYGTEDYTDFFAAGVYQGKTAVLYSAGPAFSWEGWTAGSTDAYDSSGYAALYTDKNDGGILHAVRLMDWYALPGGSAPTAEQLYGESRMNFHATNAFRLYHGLNPFQWSEAAAEASRLHSQDMADQNYFAHNSLDGRSPWTRMEAQGINWRAAAENISAGRKLGIDAYDGWVNSAGHRANMLGSCAYLGVGGGYNSGSDYGYYMTQDFYS